MSVVFEVIYVALNGNEWGAEEFVWSRHRSLKRAQQAMRSNRLNVQRQIHGWRFRIDQVTTVPAQVQS